MKKYSSFGEKDPEHKEFNLGKCILFTMGSLLMRPWSTTPSTKAARMAFVM